MKRDERRLRKLENQFNPDQTPWSMERVNGILTGPSGQTMTDEEYLRRKAERLPLTLVWSDEAPEEH